MIEVTAKTLEDAYKKAAQELSCSITDLDTTILQHESKGLFGLFVKEAKIQVSLKHKKNKKKVHKKHRRKEPTKSIQELIPHIRSRVENLFSHLCFDVELVEVSAFDEKTVFIKFDGKDVALLIGKDGYRYKMISYILFNWINVSYGLLVRFEISDFFKKQEEALIRYIETLRPAIEEDSRIRTKTLDGALLRIALDLLRKDYPHKYIAMRQQKNGDRFILIDNQKQDE